MPYKTIAVLLLGLAYATFSFSQKSGEFTCQPDNGIFRQTYNKNALNYLLFQPSGSSQMDTLMRWNFLYYVSPPSIPDFRDSLLNRYQSGLFLDCSFQDSTAVFLSTDEFIGRRGYGLYVFKQQNDSWKEINMIRLPHTDYTHRGNLLPGENVIDEKYEFISHDIILQNTCIYDLVHSKSTEVLLKYKIVTKRFKIDYENLKIIPLE